MLFKLGLALFYAAAAAVADDAGATTSAVTDPPEWAAASTMQLQLTLHSSKPSAQFAVVPSTTHIGLNQSSNTLKSITVSGSMVAIDTGNYNDVRGRSYIAYLSCDNNDKDSFISPDKMLNTLMNADLSAIVLYSTSMNWCSFYNDGPSDYSSILSMADSGDAAQVAKYLKAPDGNLPAVITGTGGSDSSSKKSGSSGNSTVAMSVLYSITGLITLLFLVIIVTGTVRAHRHPERYGPRGAFGGRPRQSRAKGIARAVLDTIPIVKFGNQEPTKPDPEVELDSASTVPQEANAPDRRNSHASSSQAVVVTGATGEDVTTSNKRSSTVGPVSGDTGVEDNSVGCSICTEDFRVGEDVRVLPCSHQFHPGCVDPWLINVSGTCPLCRLDLQPDKKKTDDRRASASTSEISDALPPPLNLDLGDSRINRTGTQRLSHFFDTNRLRMASREERLAALREMRATMDSNEAGNDDGEDEGRHNASLAAKLKEKFRIRTRAQSSAPADHE